MSGRGDDAFWRTEEERKAVEDAWIKSRGLSVPSFPDGTRKEEFQAQSMAEMMGDFFKPEVAADHASSAPSREEISPDAVNHPAHYKQYPVDVIDIIRYVLGPEGFRAYCIGNELKYRLRAGDKGDAAQDLAKAMKYREFRERKLPEFVREQAS